MNDKIKELPKIYQEKIARLDKFIENDTFRLKYLRKYYEQYTDKINILYKELVSSETPLAKKEQLENLIYVYVVKKDRVKKDIDELDRLLKSVSRDKEGILDGSDRFIAPDALDIWE